MWAFLIDIRSHPIYQREQGRWGEVNEYYKRVSNYLWLLIFAIPILFFTNFFSPLSILGSQDYAMFFVTTCLPNLAVQLITWIGLFSAPAMTAPAIVEEMRKGSWDILRLTPMPVHEIVFAKLLGGLSHLKIWIPLLLISILQVILLGAGLLTTIAISFELDTFVPLVLGAVALLARPWLEIGFAGFTGITISLWATSSRAALISSYAIILVVKLILSNIAGLFIGFSLAEFGFDLLSVAFSTAAPLLLYIGLIFIYLILILSRSRYLGSV